METILDKYPNLQAIVDGRISGQFQEWPMIRRELINLVDDLPPAPCVRCGECCKASACGFGQWDSERDQCVYLEESKSDLPCALYHCGIHDDIIKDPTSVFSPAFGAGCCRTLFNESRQAIVQCLLKAHTSLP